MNAWRAIVALIVADGDKKLFTWGADTSGALGIDPDSGNKSSPVQIGSSAEWTEEASVGYHFSVGIKTDGTLWSWGDNTNGNLGDDSVTDRSSPVETIAGGTDWVKVSAANSQSDTIGQQACAIKEDGTLWCWGDNDHGQLGDLTQVKKSSPIQVGAGTDWAEIRCGERTTHGIKTDGTLWGWGYNFYGQIGIGTNGISSYRSSPIQVGADTDWDNFGAPGSGSANCSSAQKDDGTIWLWGRNNVAQLAQNNLTNYSSPVQEITTTAWKVRGWAPGGSNTIAVKTDGTMWGWGYNPSGQVGDGSTTNRSSPVQIVGYSAGLYSWGQGTQGQMGNDTTTQDNTSPELLAGPATWVLMSGGIANKCGIKQDGTLWTWGAGTNGQLGNDAAVSTSSPVQVGLNTTWAQATMGSDFGSGIKTDGTLWMWGTATGGILGNLTSAPNLSSPTQTSLGGTDWAVVECSSANRVAAAIKTDGTLWTWGHGNAWGTLGNGPSGSFRQSSPIQVGIETTWSQLGGIGEGFVAIKTDGTLWGWGQNNAGQLGLGDTAIRSSPVQVGAGTDWAKCDGGRNGAAAVKTDGTLWCWGEGSFGGIGDGASVDRSSPVQTSLGGTDWANVEVGGHFTLGLKTDGTLWGWGYNLDGQLGNGNITGQTTPVQNISGGTNWTSIFADGYHSGSIQLDSLSTSDWDKATGGGIDQSFALKTDGSLWSWGLGTGGMLGDGTEVSKSSPIQTSVDKGWLHAKGGYRHSIGIRQNVATNTLWSWGSGNWGGLGDNSVTAKSSPVQTSVGGTNWAKMSRSRYGGLAIKTDGTLWAWGRNFEGQVGDGTVVQRNTPVQIGFDTNWSSIGCGYYASSAVKTDGTLWTWGNNQFGGLGHSDTTKRSSPTQVGAGTDWLMADTDRYSSGGLKTDGTLWTWGRGHAGILGGGNNTDISSPVQVGVDTDWVIFNSGINSMGSIKTDGTLWMWGRGNEGQLGDGSTLTKSSPVQESTLGTTWVSFDVGTDHCGAINEANELWMWGNNNFGHLADETIITRSNPQQTVSNTGDWSQVACGSDGTIAVKTDGTLWGWGQNNVGQIGDGTIVNKSSPVQNVAGGTDWTTVTAGSNSDTFSALRGETAYGLWTWGKNDRGELGDGTTVDKSSPVQTISGGVDWIKVGGSGGSNSGFNSAVGGIKADGTLWMWGLNTSGELGDETVVHKSSPVQTVAGGTDWADVSTGNVMSFGLKNDGTLWSWGQNFAGQLGHGDVGYHSSPVQVIGAGSDWVQVNGGTTFASGIKADGTLWTWGYNGQGQIGQGIIGTFANRSSPVQTSVGGTDWAQVSAGEEFIGAIKTDGSLWMWGGNGSGRHGDGTINTTKSSPVQTVPGNDWSQISCGKSHTGAIKTDGSLWMWGDNASGALGDDAGTADKSSPVQTASGGNDWAYVQCGGNATIALKTDGTVWTWGLGFYGILGDNTSTTKSSPVQTITGGTNWSSVSIGYYTAYGIRGT